MNFNIACIQISPNPDFQTSLDEAIFFGQDAVDAGADVLALPEYCGGLKTEGSLISPPHLPEESHPVLKGLIEFAKNKKKYILIGSIAISSPEGKIFNRSYIIDDYGRIISRYDKIHLFDIKLSEKYSYLESRTIKGGEKAVISKTPFGCFGQTICYDLRFPNLFRELSKNGAEILFVPSAFTKKTGEAHWHVLNRARAIENGSFVVSPCSVGKIEGGGECFGHSLIINPWGKILADGGERPGFINVNINLEEVYAMRTRIPSLRNDKPFRF
tara:strand:- start:179 stop:994 length:816 start_codon:yes stop_codon:yes gene_type:complete